MLSLSLPLWMGVWGIIRWLGLFVQDRVGRSWTLLSKDLVWGLRWEETKHSPQSPWAAPWPTGDLCWMPQPNIIGISQIRCKRDLGSLILQVCPGPLMNGNVSKGVCCGLCLDIEKQSLCSPQGPSVDGSDSEHQPLGNTPESLESEERRREGDSKGTNMSLSNVCKCLFSDF